MDRRWHKVLFFGLLFWRLVRRLLYERALWRLPGCIAENAVQCTCNALALCQCIMQCNALGCIADAMHLHSVHRTDVAPAVHLHWGVH